MHKIILSEKLKRKKETVQNFLEVWERERERERKEGGGGGGGRCVCVCKGEGDWVSK